jgi:hypothetical protein
VLDGSLIDAALDLAWSHWSGLGVRGVARAPRTAVDPEALLYFTGAIAQHDPRLRDEVADWLSKYRRHVSRPRLNALAGRFDESVVKKYAALEAELASITKTSGKSSLERLDTPARSLLRLRCVFGANARAEIILELLARGEDGSTALALSEVGYSKRNIALVLEELVLAGLVAATKEGNRVRYRVVDLAAVERVLQPLPTAAGRWHLKLPIIASFLELSERIHVRDAQVQGIEARRTLNRLMPRITALDVATPLPAAVAETFWPTLQQWVVENLIAEPQDDRHWIPGLVPGAWFAPGREIGRPGRLGSAVLPRLTAAPEHDQHLVCLDLVQVPTVVPPEDWDWAVLSVAATSTYEHSIGLNANEAWRFVTWSGEGRRVFSASYAEPLAPDRIASLYGEEAAARARRDQPAVQLALRRSG